MIKRRKKKKASKKGDQTTRLVLRQRMNEDVPPRHLYLFMA